MQDADNLLSFEELRRANVARCEQLFHPIDSWTATDWACALAGEAGEACDAVKKLRRLDDGLNHEGDPATPEECIELIAQELADTVLYADLLAARLGINLGEAIRDKFNILSERMGSDIKL